MADNNDENELDALKVSIASLREKIAALATGMKKFTETKSGNPNADGEREERIQGDPQNEGNGHDAYTDFQHLFYEMRIHPFTIIFKLNHNVFFEARHG